MGYILIVIVGFLFGWHGHSRKAAVIGGLVLSALSSAVWLATALPWRNEVGLETPAGLIAFSLTATAVISVLVALAGHWVGRRVGAGRATPPAS